MVFVETVKGWVPLPPEEAARVLAQWKAAQR